MQADDPLLVPDNLEHNFNQIKQSGQIKGYMCLTLEVQRNNQQKKQYIVSIFQNQSEGSQWNCPLFMGIQNDKIQFKCITLKDLIQKPIIVCSNEDINQQLKKYVIINYSLHYPHLKQGSITYNIAGYQTQNTEISSLEIILANIYNQYKKVWNDYTTIYNRLSSKTNTTAKSKHINICDLMPIIQYIVTPVLIPKANSKNKIVQERINYKEVPIIMLGKDMQSVQGQLKIKQKTQQAIILSLTKEVQQGKDLLYLANYRFLPNKIFNPHIFAKPKSKDKYKLYLVRGCYEFYHYGDQNFNDNGWGCAYRAFQTLYSWLNFQGYTEPLIKMISILEIQEKIDNIDYSRKLKGKKDWIGATEISWLVSRLTRPEINCKILHLSDGKQILDKCEELKHHFMTVGSPVMYGGGQYAYTILGMYYNWKFGECQFLILDPHYTGEDEYSKIIEKKGLAWRSPDQMFKKGIFYNFCLPIIK